MCNMNQLLNIAANYCLTVIEDAACSLGSFQGGKHSGTFGLTGILSFNSNKIITTGGGGAVLTNDEFTAKRARHLITQAKNSSIEYFHDALGYNYRLVNPLAAIGVGQIELLPNFIKNKRYIVDIYSRNLKSKDIQFQVISSDTVSNFWHIAILTERSEDLISYLSDESIETKPLWLPINELPIFRKDIYASQHNYAKQVSNRGLMLPCSTSITDQQILRICQAIKTFI